MPRLIIKIKDCYLAWSTIVDAPVTFGLKLRDFMKFWQTEYGKQGLSQLHCILPDVDKFGTSVPGLILEKLLEGNRAGRNEIYLSKDEIYKVYCQLKTKSVLNRKYLQSYKNHIKLKELQKKTHSYYNQ